MLLGSTSASSQTPRRTLGRRADSPAGRTAGETATLWSASTSRGEAGCASNSSWLPPYRNENARHSPSRGKKNVIFLKPRRGMAGVFGLLRRKQLPRRYAAAHLGYDSLQT